MVPARVAEYRGDYDGSRRFHERALALRTEIGDRRGIGYSMSNLGMIDALQRRFQQAHDWFEQSMRLSREVGDAWMFALCHNNLGNATRGLSQFETAGRHYAESRRAYRNYDDPWSMAFLLEDIGVLAALRGSAASALELIGAADGLREANKMPRAPSREQEITEQFAGAAGGMSEEQRQALRARGRSLSLAAAVVQALELCDEGLGTTKPEATQEHGHASRALLQSHQGQQFTGVAP